jgi:hypothetical protein
MAYELHLKADDIHGLANQVEKHWAHLQTILTGRTVAQSNQVAAASVLEDGDNFTLPHVSQTFVAQEVQSSTVDAEGLPSWAQSAQRHRLLSDVTLDGRTFAPSPSTSTVDADGMPWDERIHSSNRKMTARGVWTRRKNVDDAVYNSVVAELRGAPQAPITTAFAADLPHPDQWVPTVPPIESQQFPPAIVQPVYAVPAPAPVATYTINDLFIKLQQLFANGQADVAYMNSLNSRLSQMYNVQVNSINDVATRADMIASAFELIAQDGK